MIKRGKRGRPVTDSPARGRVFRMPPALVEAMNERIEVDGYGSRGRSRWIREAYRAMFKADPDFKRSLRGLNEYGDKCETSIALSGNQDFWIDLTDGAIRVRQRALLLSGPESKLIRAGVIYRLKNREAFD